MAQLARSIPEIPAIELVDGKPHRKVSPTLTHALVQGALVRLLAACGADRGCVAPEWHLRVGKAPGTDDVLVPDVAFVTFERLAALDARDREIPPLAPEICIEVWSPNDDRGVLRRKIEKYRAAGAALVLDVNPYDRSVTAYDRDGECVFSADATFARAAVTWLRFAVADVFAPLDALPEGR